jgi:hypothetical protein
MHFGFEDLPKAKSQEPKDKKLSFCSLLFPKVTNKDFVCSIIRNA